MSGYGAMKLQVSHSITLDVIGSRHCSRCCLHDKFWLSDDFALGERWFVHGRQPRCTAEEHRPIAGVAGCSSSIKPCQLQGDTVFGLSVCPSVRPWPSNLCSTELWQHLTAAFDSCSPLGSWVVYVQIRHWHLLLIGKLWCSIFVHWLMLIHLLRMLAVTAGWGWWRRGDV